MSIYMGFSKPTLLRFHETTLNHDVGGGFKQFVLFTREIGEMFLLDEHIIQLGWFNHVDLVAGNFVYHPENERLRPLKFGTIF